MQNYFKNYTLTILFTFFIFLGLFAQQNNLPELGLDNDLCNGKYYSHYYSKSVDGNQFLVNTDFTYATVWKKNSVFDSVLLNYDVLNNEVVIESKTKLGAIKIISLSLFELDSFMLNDRVFVVDIDNSSNRIIYQKIYYNQLEIRKYISKELLLLTKLDNVKHSFSGIKRDVYFYDSVALFKVSTKRQFVKAIDKNRKKDIKKYFKGKSYKYSNMSDLEYLELLIFINTLKDE